MSQARLQAPIEVHLSDQYLLEQAAQGDQRAFEELVQRYQSGLSRFVRKYLGSEEAQDVLQSTWLQLYLSLPRLCSKQAQEESSPFLRGWLYRVAYNRCIDVWRRQKRESAHLVGTPRSSVWERSWDEEGEPPLVEVPDVAPLPEELAERAEIARGLRTHLSTLPPKQRAALWLRGACGLGFQEIASLLQIPRNTAKTYHYRGCTRLRATLLRAQERVVAVRVL